MENTSEELGKLEDEEGFLVSPWMCLQRSGLEREHPPKLSQP